MVKKKPPKFFANRSDPPHRPEERCSCQAACCGRCPAMLGSIGCGEPNGGDTQEAGSAPRQIHAQAVHESAVPGAPPATRRGADERAAAKRDVPVYRPDAWLPPIAAASWVNRHFIEFQDYCGIIANHPRRSFYSLSHENGAEPALRLACNWGSNAYLEITFEFRTEGQQRRRATGIAERVSIATVTSAFSLQVPIQGRTSRDVRPFCLGW
jgi:hypothetical protein